MKAAADALLDNLEQVIVGKREVLRLVVTALLADGHVLLEDVPGVAKTATARALAEAAGLEFSRVQFTPDLIPADITGSAVFTGKGGDDAIEFKPGPIFANLVLGDEINRAPPKTQSALLEAMEERQVTVDGETRRLPNPFLVIGTQNPIESEGTYPLPEAQLDRFLIRTGIGYPSLEAEIDLVLRRAARGTDKATLHAQLDAERVAALQRRVEEVYISQPVAQYVVQLVEATRQSPRTEAGASPRGSLALLKASRAAAAMAGRSYVLPDDVKALCVPCLAHRLILLPDQWVRGVRPDQVIDEVIAAVPAPVATDEGEDDVTPVSPSSAPPQSQQPNAVAPQPNQPQPVQPQQTQPQHAQPQQAQPQPTQPQPTQPHQAPPQPARPPATLPQAPGRPPQPQPPQPGQPGPPVQ